VMRDENMDENKEKENVDNGMKIIRLSGMYEDYFLDYASYVILERAVPHLHDGLKPVHRRILHAMKKLDDGRYNKVANIIGYTMSYHPHGDASIGDALVQLGQKDLLIDCQGNWGNYLTGDGAAAPRYIEARLSKFALDVVFNPKTTEWKNSYDGRNKEPLTLPVKFPLLLTQGVEGIAVGLASKIVPHNFNELIDASILHLQGKKFELFPDFPTGGMIDMSRYNDGQRGGVLKVRAKIEKLDKKTLVITELPFGKNTATLIESIIKANEKGKIKLRKIDDNTSEKVQIQLHLAPGVSPDQMIDALYAFTDCENSISPNACVIVDDAPKFLGVSEMLQISTDQTRELLKKELEIRMQELKDDWHAASLEKIFIINELYEPIKLCKTEEEILDAIDKGLEPFKKDLLKPVTREDLIKLSNIPIRRISKFSSFKADQYIQGLEDEMKEVQNHMDHIIEFTINYFRQIKKKYGQGRERKTEIRNFENIEATKVVLANEKLYVNRSEGFIGTGMKKDEYVCDCSDIDEVIVIREDGKYLITKVAEKSFVGKNILHVNVFKRNDKRTIYNCIYRDGMNGKILIKRISIHGVTRDKEYDLTKGTPGSKILYLTANPNGEAELLRIRLKPRPKLRKIIFDVNFGDLAIKGRNSMGNILTKYAIHKIEVKEKGVSTLGGRKIWFDDTVLRLNTDERGNYLGEFHGDEKILVVKKSGAYELTSYELTNHYDEDILHIEKFDDSKVFSAVFFDADQGYHYVKRFTFEPTEKEQSFIGDNPENRLVLLSEEQWPQIKITYGGKTKKEDETLDVDEFIGVKSYRARGKRLTTNQVKTITETEPLEKEIRDETADETTDDEVMTENGSFTETSDEEDADNDNDVSTTPHKTGENGETDKGTEGQMKLF
jgi:topoisomerase IV subunit A